MEMNHACLNILHRIALPDFLDYMHSVFPYLYAVDTDNSIIVDLHIPGQVYSVMYEHVNHFKFPNLVGGFSSKIKLKLDRLAEAAQKSALERSSKTPSVDKPSGKLIAEQIPAKVKAGETCRISVNIFNQSKETWYGYGTNPVLVSYHWQVLDSDNYLIFDGGRTQLSVSSIQAGESTQVLVKVFVPSQKGKFRLILTLVQEGVSWFEDRGFEVTSKELEII
jgi:hypothetical protein